ncbi:nitroreductase family protein [Lachnospiraceae bacterium MD1]|uniref:Nitroreductase family protein n=1 Tax=Variimorphobacter saccharofermentans TaxID=2755051 RepID=A0A839K540_9FIRM|nr:nitroreductase family protein [Variimorphobacter saccharofermentans]MBB2184302.1 nitroreductase family protein [Variimorphobacter saccharofermentans]
MDLYTAINQRHTIRDFQDKEVPTDVLHRILNAGLKAPTNDHMRNWEFIVITDPVEKAKIISKIPKKISKKQVEDFLERCQMSDTSQRAMYMDAVPKQYQMLYYSSALVLPLFRQDTPLLKPKTLSDLNAFASIWCCIDHILLAATAEGLGVALRIPFDKEIKYLKEVLGHPDNYFMPCYLSIGYPVENASLYKQHEFDIKEKLHINRW